MNFYSLNQFRRCNWRVCVISILMCLGLNGCGDNEPMSQQQGEATAVPHSETFTKQTTPEPAPSEHTIPATIQKQVQLIPETAAPQLNLDISTTHLETIQEQQVDLLHRNAAQKIIPAKKAGKKLEVGGGIITDPEAENLGESVDGAEVKLDLKWD